VASAMIHVVALAYFVSDGPAPAKKEVIIEFAPEALVDPSTAPPEPVKTTGIAHVDHGDPGERSKDSEPQPATQRAAALEALMAIDFAALRSDVVQTGLAIDGPSVRAAGFSPVDPTIHLTEGEVDSLVTTGHGLADHGKKRDIKGTRRGQTACLPPTIR